MQISATWSKPIQLKKCKPGGLIYELDLDALPNEPGVYVFYRQHGSKPSLIYIGETYLIRARTKGHLCSLPLMRAIENSPTGKRYMIYCTVDTASRERAKKQVKIIEKALILHAQTEGHELFNKKGTKLPTDEISFTGNRASEAIAPRTMLVKKALTSSRKKSAA
jgi:hypothetical protein